MSHAAAVEAAAEEEAVVAVTAASQPASASYSAQSYFLQALTKAESSLGSGLLCPDQILSAFFMTMQ